MKILVVARVGLKNFPIGKLPVTVKNILLRHPLNPQQKLFGVNPLAKHVKGT